MVNTQRGAWSRYKKLVKRPDQIKGRNLLHHAMKQAAKGLELMWGSMYKDYVKTDPGIEGKYRFALYYLIKYLIEQKGFDKVADEKVNRPVHFIFTRGNNELCWSSNVSWPSKQQKLYIVGDAVRIAINNENRRIAKTARKLYRLIDKDIQKAKAEGIVK